MPVVLKSFQGKSQQLSLWKKAGYEDADVLAETAEQGRSSIPCSSCLELGLSQPLCASSRYPGFLQMLSILEKTCSNLPQSLLSKWQCFCKSQGTRHSSFLVHIPHCIFSGTWRRPDKLQAICQAELHQSPYVSACDRFQMSHGPGFCSQDCT